MRARVSVGVWSCVLLLIAGAAPAEAQYFGKNKVRYEDLEFQSLRTRHFDVYFARQQSEVAQAVGRLAERWYARIASALDHELSGRQPIVLYGSHPDFAQTAVVPGFLGDEIGGITEGNRRRIAMPVSAGLAETDRVLGHEIVHAFQYDIADETGRSLASLPLWFVEGMAEYVVSGEMDPHTAMTMRDAVRHDRLSSIGDLETSGISPYRAGQALWSWLASRFGDDILARVLKAPSSNAYRRLELVTGHQVDLLTADWHRDLGALAPSTNQGAVVQGDLLVGHRNGDGRINIAPSLSPDGRRMVFLSERDRLSIDVYVTDARPRAVPRKLASTVSDSRFDSLQFLNSAAAWSPDGTRILLAVVRQSRPVLAIYDAADGSRLDEVVFDRLDQVFYPAWSPDGARVAFTGLDRGQSDLYVYDFDSRSLVTRTFDAYADLQPSWSPDSERIVFVSDRFSTDLANLDFGPYRLAVMDLKTKKVTAVEGTPNGHVLDPQWLPDGSGLYFRRLERGVTNVHRLDFATGICLPITDADSGIVGVTPLSPALSIARTSGRLAFTAYRNGVYEIRTIVSPRPLKGRPPESIEYAVPPEKSPTAAMVADAATGLPSAQSFPVERYASRISLDAIGQPYFFMSSGGSRSFLIGGISAAFGDLLGRHVVGASIRAGTTFEALAADVQYLNRSSRWNWGLGAGLQPYVYSRERRELIPGDAPALAKETERQRQMHLSFAAVAAYPFDRTRRIEARIRYYTIWSHHRVRSRLFELSNGGLLSDETVERPDARTLSLVETSVAFVRDTAVWGPVSPIRGHRTRLDIGPTFGGADFLRVRADYRQYWMPVRPFTLAVRGLHVGRYGSGGDHERLLPLSIGRAGLVRGYRGQHLEYHCAAQDTAPCQATDVLAGSKMLAAQAEVRFPLQGLRSRRLHWGAVPIEGAVFAEGASAWSDPGQQPWRANGAPWIAGLGAGVRTRMGAFGMELDVVRKTNGREAGWSVVLSMHPGF